ncbi:STAS domain-containing protein [Pseudonocardia sp. ICBG1293]|uniref:STAS domain-containing protein n=1 Tax=Pseudonocardia sp. ICBG1293 TaxID=2844382 RepID=UPI001CCB29A1|nr:STAS domain-containing protein [Pseudonocardia sp. ICBG1293]
MSDPRELSLTWTSPAPDLAVVTLSGDLDYASSDALTDGVGALLRDRPTVRELRIDCAGVGYCDSYGLSSLLMIRRRTRTAGAALHLDNRGDALERLLRVTSTLEHLTGAGGRAREQKLDT